MYSSNNTVRAMSGFSIDQVGDEVLELRRKQANYIISDLLLADITTRTALGTLTDKEKFELSIGESELTVVLLCYTLALKYTMTKDNKSFTAGNGGVSYRDTTKNLDFLNMAKTFWAQAWQQMTAYVTDIPNVTSAGVDPYTNGGFRITKNYDTNRSVADLVDDPIHEFNWGNFIGFLNGEIMYAY